MRLNSLYDHLYAIFLKNILITFRKKLLSIHFCKSERKNSNNMVIKITFNTLKLNNA